MANQELVAVVDQKKRKEMFETMTPECRNAASEIEKLDHQARRGTVLVAWDMGAWVNRVANDDAKFGASAVAQIAAYLAYPGGASALNLLRDLVLTFPERKFIVEQLKDTRKNMRPLDLGIFMALAKVADKRMHKTLLKQVREENLTVNELEQRLKAEYDRKNTRNSGGRKPQVPSSPLACLQKGYDDAHKLGRYLKAMRDETFDKLDALEAGEVDQRSLQKLEAFETELIDAQVEIEAALKRIVKSKAYFHKCLNKADTNADGDELVPVTRPKSGKKKGKKKKALPGVKPPIPALAGGKLGENGKAHGKKKRRRPAPV